jgi:hypothetical protein
MLDRRAKDLEGVGSSSKKLFEYKSLIPWLLFPIITSLSYWVVSYFYLSRYPFYLRVAIRSWEDYVFLWLIKSLSQFDFHPTYVFEAASGSLQPSPLLSLLPYALGLRLFGDAGFLVADAVVVALAFVMFAVFLRLAGVRRHWALMIAVGAIAVAYLIWPAQISPNFMFAYSFRFPRPLVSQIFFIGCLSCLVAQMATDVGSRRYVKLSALYAVCLALLIQSDAFSVFATVIAYALVLLWQIRRAGGIAFKQIAALALTGLITIVLSTPFFVQMLASDTSVQQRMGFFVPPHRLEMVANYATDKNTVRMVAVFVVFSVLAGWLLRMARRHSLADAAMGAGLRFVPIIGISALLAPAMFLLLSPTVAQVFHLKLVQLFLAILTAFILAGVGLTIFTGRLDRDGAVPNARLRRTVVGGAIAVSTLATIAAYGGMVLLFAREPRPSYPPRLSFWQEAAPARFNADLSAVLKVLEPLQRDANAVLATNEQLVATWWVFERGGKVLVPDPFATTLKTIELDRRLVYFHQVLGDTKSEFPDIAQRLATMRYVALYQATSSYTFSDISDYTDEQQKLIRSSPWDSWVVFMPRSEVERFSRLYDDRGPRYRIDVIVLQKTPDLPSRTPIGFVRELDNANFSVWVKQP